MILREFESTLEMNNIKFSAQVTVEVYYEPDGANIFVLAKAMGLSGHSQAGQFLPLTEAMIDRLVVEHSLVEEALDELANNIRTAANALRPFAADEE